MKDNEETLAILEEIDHWQSEEPTCRGYEVRINMKHDKKRFAVTMWSLKEGGVSRWGIVTGYGNTLDEAHCDGIAKRRERIPEDPPLAVMPA
jgi:hypothetical protein